MTERTPYPATKSFRWEPRTYPYADAADMMRTLAKQGGTAARQRAYLLTADRIEQRDHDDMTGTEITGAEIKRMLTDAARDAEWWLNTDAKFHKPAPAPEGHKTCFVCAQAKPKAEFMATPTVAQAKRYGWRPDTTQKLPTHVCADCRRKRADNAAKKRKRTAPRKDANITDPRMQERMHQYAKVKTQIVTHLNRVNSAIGQALKTIEGIDDMGEPITVREYQFTSEERKDFFMHKRDMLLIARDRLDGMLGEDTPIPARWGMLLSKPEQDQLTQMHEQAFAQTAKQPQLW